MSELELDIQRVSDGLSPDDRQIHSWVQAALGGIDAIVNLRLVDEDEARATNLQWRDRDYPTNVLSFPALLPPLDGKRVLGDIMLCVPVIEREAAEQGKRLDSHWAHMVIHGILHLLGFDHTQAAQAEEMEALEIEILASLDVDNPYDVP